MVFLILVLEASRRAVGNIITLLALFFIVYAFVGPYLGGLFNHRGVTLSRLIDLQFLSPNGIFGVPVSVAANYVFYFVLFGAFLEVSGGGKLFIDIAYKLTKRGKGGPAKAAVLSSGFMGSISGSAVANVVTTGIFTIPLMKKSGYSSKDSAAIEATASTGGQLMPPIMGAAAFIMAETLGVPYLEIILAALIPALLYYISLLFIVHLKASKENLIAIEDKEKDKEKILNRIHLLFSLVVLLTLLFMGYSLQVTAFWAIVSIVGFSYLRRKTIMKLVNIIEALEKGAKQAVKVTIPCAVAGIIVGIITFSGLGLKFTSIIVQWSSGTLIIALILVALASIILGMGMPTTSAYIMAAVLLAPALAEFGVHPIAAHLFILYFAVLSMITPPIALAAYSAAGISGSNMNETGFRALLFSSSGVLIPFMFVYNPALIMIGDVSSIALVTFTTIIGVMGLSASIVGYLFTNMNLSIRLVTLAASLSLIIPNVLTDIMGVLIFCIIFIFQRNKYKNNNNTVAA